MAIIKCKMCGGDLALTEGQSVAECEYCGTLQTVPSADNEKKLNLFASANKLRLSCEFDRAAGIYDAIKAEFPIEAEAYWGLVLCKYGIEYVDDPATGKKIPTCHRLSYDSVLDDANLELAMDYADTAARRVYREEARHLEKLRTGILEVSSQEKPYDIFLCYKETDENGDRTLDSVLAQNLYTALTERGYRVFFSRITLQSKLGEAYEPYIFAALNSAKVMLAIGTDPEYYSAVWVKNEWSRYLKICAEDKTRHLIPCYKDMDAYDLPREFRPLQGVDLGKMGADQDILFNMEKYIPLQKKVLVQEKVVVGGTGGSNKIASLLDRGNMALEDGDWAKADSFFEDVLNNDSKNAQAYIGKTLAQEKCRTMDALVRKRRDAHQNVAAETLYIKEKTAHISEKAEQYALPGYVEQQTIRELYRFDLSYTSEVSGRQKQYREEENWWQNHRQLSRAEKFAAGAVAEHLQSEKKHLFAQLADRVKKAQEADARSVSRLEAAYDAHIAEGDRRAEAIYNDGLARRKKDYETWLAQAKKETAPDALKKLAQNFAGLGDYQDSRNLAEHCRKRAAEEQAKLDAEAERKRKARQKRTKTIAIVSAACIVLAVTVTLVVTKVIIPGNKYKAAVALMENGQYVEAIAAFEAMDGYKDSAQKIEDCEIGILENKYIDAVALMDAGQYEDAIVAFDDLGKYKDSNELREKCYTAMMDSKYNEAVKMMVTDVVQAYEALLALDGYKDSAEKADSIYDEYTSIRINTAEVGDYILFGTYEQDNNTVNGKEDIEWLVLAKEDERLLVISKFALDCREFNSVFKATTWEECSLRKWLNNDFINKSFSPKEKTMILETLLSDDINSDYGTYPGQDTLDKVFLLSIAEAEQYFSTDQSRICIATDYAEAQGAPILGHDGMNACYWWLRSPGYSMYSGGHSKFAAEVGTWGEVRSDGDLAHADGSVRPALWIVKNPDAEQ